MRRRKKVWYFWFCWIDFLPFFLEIVNHDVVNHSQHSDYHIKLTWQLRPKCSFKQNHFPEKKKHLILLKVVLLKCSTLNLVAVNLCHLNNPSYIITFFFSFLYRFISQSQMSCRTSLWRQTVSKISPPFNTTQECGAALRPSASGFKLPCCLLIWISFSVHLHLVLIAFYSVKQKMTSLSVVDIWGR